LRLFIRGQLTDITTAALLDNATHQIVFGWDGVTLRCIIDGVTYTPAVGVAANETTQEILMGANFSATPEQFFAGYGICSFGDRPLVAAELARLVTYNRNKFGSA